MVTIEMKPSVLKVLATLALMLSHSMQASASSEQPNILWLVIEDMSPLLPMYGDDSIETPNISRLADEGVVYNNVFSTSGVCAPSRAALATGLYPSGFGANNMRTSSNTEETGLPKYEAVPPQNTKMLSQLLREAGYYTANNYKNDYQFKAPKTAWDENGIYAHWRNRPSNQPFFSIFNFTTTHESGLFEPYGIRKLEQRHYFSSDADKISALPNDHRVKTDEDSTPVHVDPETKFPVPPYLPDTPIVRRDLWKVYNNLAETDKQIGAILKVLEDDGLLDSTIIVFYSDHGGPMPRQKRLIYDSGLKVPLIIRFPNGQKAGTIEERLVSFVDFAPTTLAMAGVPIPDYMQGENFLNTANEREYIYAAADRFDGFTDTIRAVRDHCYKYIRNYRPNEPYYLPVAYREKIPSMRVLLALNDAGKLNEAQSQWFRKTKDVHELFNVCSDPHELSNLAYIKNYQNKRKDMESALNNWLKDIGDDPLVTERQLITSLWDDASTQPKTEAPELVIENGKAVIASETPGAFISFRYKWDKTSQNWQIYKEAQPIKPGLIEAVAHRPGYIESATTTLSVEEN